MKRNYLYMLILAGIVTMLADAGFKAATRKPQVTAPIILSSITPVPEPSTYALFGVGALALIIISRKRK